MKIDHAEWFFSSKCQLLDFVKKVLAGPFPDND